MYSQQATTLGAELEAAQRIGLTSGRSDQKLLGPAPEGSPPAGDAAALARLATAGCKSVAAGEAGLLPGPSATACPHWASRTPSPMIESDKAFGVLILRTEWHCCAANTGAMGLQRRKLYCHRSPTDHLLVAIGRWMDDAVPHMPNRYRGLQGGHLSGESGDLQQHWQERHSCGGASSSVRQADCQAHRLLSLASNVMLRQCLRPCSAMESLQPTHKQSTFRCKQHDRMGSSLRNKCLIAPFGSNANSSGQS